MKVVFALLCLVAAGTCQLNLPPEELRKVIGFNTECQKQSGAAPQEIMATLQGTFSDSPALKNHVLCLGTKMGFISEDGQLQRDYIKSNMQKVVHDEAKIDSVLDKCLLQKGNARDTAYESTKCMSQNKDMILDD